MFQHITGDGDDIVIEMVEVGIGVVAVEAEADGVNAVHTGLDGGSHCARINAIW